MPRKERTLAAVKRSARGRTPAAPTLGPGNLLISCEHASNRIPPRYARLGLPAKRLLEHIAWDPGAAIVARTVSRAFGCPVHLGRWSRLLVDLNRSVGHPQHVVAVTHGVRVPGNVHITPDEYVRRLQRFYVPYRDAVTDDVAQIVAQTGACLHLSMHSFTPILGRDVRNFDIGLLFDPRRTREAAFAQRLRLLLEEEGLRVRFNAPYSGTSDALVTALRGVLPTRRYAGLEIESSQRLVGTPAVARRLARVFVAALQRVLR